MRAGQGECEQATCLINQANGRLEEIIAAMINVEARQSGLVDRLIRGNVPKTASDAAEKAIQEPELVTLSKNIETVQDILQNMSENIAELEAL